MQTKKWYQSKTVWANGLMILAAILTFLISEQSAAELLGGRALEIFGLAAGIINLVLRFVTSEPIA